MRDQVGDVLGAVARERLDPLRREPVLVGPPLPRDLRVGDVANENVPEHVCPFARDGRAPLTAHELLALERLEAVLGVLDARHVCQRSSPEHLPDDGRGLEQRLLLERERVEPRRDHSLDRVRQRERTAVLPLGEHPCVLLRVERIAARLGDELARLLPSDELLEEAGSLLLGERRERDECRVALAAAPAGPAVEELGARSAEDEDRHVRRPVDEVVDEVEEAVVRPVQILEDEDERSLIGERLHETTPGGEGLVSRFRSAGMAAQADERPQVALDPARLNGISDGVPDGETEFRLRGVGVVTLEDARVALDHLTESPEADPAAVGQGAPLAPEDDHVRIGIDERPELVDEAALAKPGHADERHELRGPLAAGALERVPQNGELLVAPDERRPAAKGDVDAETRAGGKCLPGGYRFCLPLRDDGLPLAVFDRVRGRPLCRVVDEDCVWGRRRLQARAGVDDVPCDHPLALEWSSVPLHERFPGRDADAHAGIQLRGSFARGEPGADRAFGIVLMRERCSEDREDRVTDELLHGAAEALELGAHALVIRSEDGSNLLRIHALGLLGRAHEIHEEDADRLTLLRGKRGSRFQARSAGRAEGQIFLDHGLAFRALAGDPGPAAPAEERLGRILGAACRTGPSRHGRTSLGSPAMRNVRRPGLKEALLVWGFGAAIALATFVTYARLPAEELYHTSGSGLEAGASRVVVFLGYSFSLAAIPLAWVAAARLGTRPAGVAALVAWLLCATIVIPGVIDQEDLDARPVNALAACGVAIAVGLTILAVVERGLGRARPLSRSDLYGGIGIMLLLLGGLPWIFAELGFYISDVSLLGRLFLAEEVRASPGGEPSLHAVHLGRHHGMDGVLLACSALLLFRVVPEMPSKRQTVALAGYLSLLLVYGLANAFQDFWIEQLVKRGTTSLTIPSLIRPALSSAWAAMLIAAALIWFAAWRVVRVDKRSGGDS
jgi:hypothetical protein